MSFKSLYKEEYRKIINDNYIEQWKNILDNYLKNFNLDNISDNVKEELMIFLHCYSMIISNIPQYQITPQYQMDNKSNDVLRLEKSILLILNDLQKFNISENELKSNIISEYYNILTGKKGILLENGVRIEDGEILDPKIKKEIENSLLKIINERIDYILDPKIRKNFERMKKLNRILKD